MINSVRKRQIWIPKKEWQFTDYKRSCEEPWSRISWRPMALNVAIWELFLATSWSWLLRNIHVCIPMSVQDVGGYILHSLPSFATLYNNYYFMTYILSLWRMFHQLFAETCQVNSHYIYSNESCEIMTLHNFLSFVAPSNACFFMTYILSLWPLFLYPLSQTCEVTSPFQCVMGDNGSPQLPVFVVFGFSTHLPKLVK